MVAEGGSFLPNALNIPKVKRLKRGVDHVIR